MNFQVQVPSTDTKNRNLSKKGDMELLDHFSATTTSKFITVEYAVQMMLRHDTGCELVWKKSLPVLIGAPPLMLQPMFPMVPQNVQWAPQVQPMVMLEAPKQLDLIDLEFDAGDASD